MRKTKKTLALFLVLAMVLTLFAGVAQASAAVTISSSVAVVARSTAEQNIVPGRIDIESATRSAVAVPLATQTERTLVRVTLPGGLKWLVAPTTTNVTFNAAAVGAASVEHVLENDGRTVAFRVNNTATTTDVDLIRFTGIQITVPAAYVGDVTATVDITAQDNAGNEVWTQSGNVPIARVFAAGTTATSLATPAVLRGVANQVAGNIRIAENVAESLRDDLVEPAIILTAPRGVRIDSLTATVRQAGGVAQTITSTEITGTGTAVVRIRFATTTQSLLPNDSIAFTFETTAIRLSVDQTVLDGPISIEVSGTTDFGVTATNVEIASVGQLGALTPSAITPPAIPTIDAGRRGEVISSIRLTENMPDAMLGDRVVTLSLPTGFTWSAAGTPGWATVAPTISSDGRTLTYWTRTSPTGAPVAGGRESFDITGLRINTLLGATVGDIVVTVGGTAGPAGTVVVGTLRSSVTATVVTVPNVRADEFGQSVGNIVITELFPGALLNDIAEGNTITLTFPVGIMGQRFARVPTVTVSDVVGSEPFVHEVSRATDHLSITITLRRPAVTPTNPATITISNQAVSFDRALRVLPGTPININVGGSAVVESERAVVAHTAGLALIPTPPLTIVGGLSAVHVANVISATARTTVFTVDSTAFTVDGVAQPALEVAPFVDPASNRTLVPLRAVAHAAGVLDRSIGWDEATQRVTLASGDRFIQFTIDVKSMVVNGVVMPIDQAPRVINGRTVLPVRALELALGVALEWDGTARTVTVKLD